MAAAESVKPTPIGPAPMVLDALPVAPEPALSKPVAVDVAAAAAAAAAAAPAGAVAPKPDRVAVARQLLDQVRLTRVVMEVSVQYWKRGGVVCRRLVAALRRSPLVHSVSGTELATRMQLCYDDAVLARLLASLRKLTLAGIVVAWCC